MATIEGLQPIESPTKRCIERRAIIPEFLRAVTELIERDFLSDRVDIVRVTSISKERRKLLLDL